MGGRVDSSNLSPKKLHVKERRLNFSHSSPTKAQGKEGRNLKGILKGSRSATTPDKVHVKKKKTDGLDLPDRTRSPKKTRFTEEAIARGSKFTPINPNGPLVFRKINGHYRVMLPSETEPIGPSTKSASAPDN